MKVNKALIESYVRNLFGQVLGAIVIVASVTKIDFASFGSHEWLLVANTLWASFVPVAIRYANKKDPAFGIVAELATSAVTKNVSKSKKAAAK
jgi:hypothetical protein